jgi:large repetitive protein
MSQTQISAPYIIGMVDEAGLPVRNPNPADAFVQGYGQPGAIISIYQNGHLEGSAIADSNGTWQFRLTTLSNGSYTDVTATATAQNGIASEMSNHLNFTSGYVPVQPVQPVQPVEPVNPVQPQPSLVQAPYISGLVNGAGESVSHPNPADAFVKGFGQAGDIINVFQNGHLEGSTTVDANGNWQFRLTTLSNGTYNDVTATATAKDGNTSDMSNHLAFTSSYVPVEPVNPDHPVDPAQPVIDPSLPAAPGLIGLVNEAGVQVWDRDVNQPQFLKGTGLAGDTVNVILNGHLEGTATVDSNGTWQFHFAGLSADTYYDVKVTETTPNGQTSNVSDSFGFTLHQPTPVEPMHLVPQTAPVVVGEHGSFVAASDAGDTVITLNADASTYFKSATAHIEGGHGVDTLQIGGDHNVLDLTSVSGMTSASKLSNVEVIDLHNAQNTLKLSLVDVLNLGEADLFVKDGAQQLMVKGSVSDSVDLSNSHVGNQAYGEWHRAADVHVGVETYAVYEHSASHVELLVQQGIQVALHA